MHTSKWWKPAGLAAVLIVGVTGRGVTARAADHFDSPSVVMDPSADITDVFAWMTADDTKLNLILNVYPNAPTGAKFSTAVLYTIHVNSRMTPFADGTDTDVRCSFDATQKVSCWIGDDPAPAIDYVTGDASSTTGITSADGKLKVFAGMRDDPFFFNFAGFTHAVATVQAVQAGPPALKLDPAGCPQLSAAQSMTLVNQLKTSADGGAPVNLTAGWNVLSIVVQVDKTMMTSGGPFVAVMGSTSALQ